MKKNLLVALCFSYFIAVGFSFPAQAELNGMAKEIWSYIPTEDRNALCHGKKGKERSAKVLEAGNTLGRDGVSSRSDRSDARREVRGHWSNYCKALKERSR